MNEIAKLVTACFVCATKVFFKDIYHEMNFFNLKIPHNGIFSKYSTTFSIKIFKFEIEFRGNIGGHTAAEGDIIGEYSSQRASRESSAVWRRTPSMRR